jgi:hypothetical protein
MMMRRTCLGLMVAALFSGGCAFTNPDNTPLLTGLDQVITPETTGGKALWSPLTVPLGLASGALDIAVVHPLQALGFAGEDTYRVLWAKPTGSFAAQAFKAVPKAALTPVAFAFYWVGESLFDLRPSRTSEP